jgi:WD40 repeat protein
MCIIVPTIPHLVKIIHHRVLRLEERATTQSARHRGQQKYQLTLLNAVKPHTKPVSSLAVDREGKVLASGSKDNTVFFLNVQDQYSPIGFIHTPAPVTTMRWSSGDKVNTYHVF